VFNNIIVDCGYEQVTFCNYQNNSRELVFEKNIIYYSGGSNLFSKGSMWGELTKERLRSDRNVFFCAGQNSPRINIMSFDHWKSGKWFEMDIARWQMDGFDRNSLVADPEFVNVLEDDFRLCPGSPALGLGFEPIDINQIGLFSKQRCHCKKWSAFHSMQLCSFRCAFCQERKSGDQPCRFRQNRLKSESSKNLESDVREKSGMRCVGKKADSWEMNRNFEKINKKAVSRSQKNLTV
jgi:hypothetical protein